MIPRLKELYNKEIKINLKDKFGYKNTYMVPEIQKIAKELGAKDISGMRKQDLIKLIYELQAKKKKVSHFHIRWINPLPKDLGEILIKFKNVLMPEINYGQLSKIIRAEYLVDIKGLNLVRGKPISSADIQEEANSLIG